MLRLFDHVYATYLPPERERDPRYAQGIGQRALFQVSGFVTQEERRHAGEMVFMPRDLRDGRGNWFPHRVPFSHLVDVETAPPGAGDFTIGRRGYDLGGG